MRRLIGVAGAGVALAVVAGCGGANAARPPGAGASASPGEQLTAGPPTQRLVAAAALAPCPASPTGPGTVRSEAAGLPALTLTCLGAGPTVQLAGLRGPALVNLWASWCRPCRAEMPQLQALHVRAGGRLLVLGVVTDDSRRNALSAAAGLGVGYASVLDTGGALRRSYGYPGPPVTLLVDRGGAVVHRIIGPLPAPAELDGVLAGHLQVRL